MVKYHDVLVRLLISSAMELEYQSMYGIIEKEINCVLVLLHFYYYYYL